MDGRDRQAIEDLFGKIAQVEERSGPRDAEAEAHMRALIARQPAAPYYMAQTIVAQEQALNEAQRRIEELQDGSRQEGGGFLGGLLGGGRQRQASPRQAAYGRDALPAGAGPWSGAGRGMGGGFGGGGMGGGGFLAGAAQTAMGVAGGVMLGSMLADWMSPDAETAGGDAANADGGAEPAADTEGGWFGNDNAGVQNADADLGDAGGGFDFDV